MELLETLPNGREIYSRPKQNIKLEKQAAVELHNTWKSSGNKYKPLFQDKNGQLWEIESGGNTFKTAANPEGYRFGNWVKHFKRGVLRRGIEKEATPNLNEVAAAVKSRFPGLSKTDNLNFAKALITLNDQEITKMLAAKKTGEHADHMIPLAKGGLNWFKNFANIDADTNLRKSDKLMSAKQIKNLALSFDRQEMILSSLSSDIVKDNPKFNFKADSIKEIFKPDSPTAKTLYKANKAVKPIKSKVNLLGKLNKAVTPIKPVAKYIPYAGAAFTLAAAKSDVQAAEKDPTWQNKLQAKLSTMDIWLEGSELATGGFTSPVTTPLQILSSVANIGIGMTEPGYKVTKEEQDKEIRRQTEGGKYDFTTM